MEKYQPRRKADENQARALEHLRRTSIWALRMGMRTRKTKPSLDDFGERELAGKSKDLLVIAPGGVYDVWATAAELDWSDDLLRRSKILVWTSRQNSRWRRMAEEFLAHEGPRALIMNVEALSNKKSPARKLVEKYLKRRPDKTYCVIDESVIIKNRSKRTQYVNRTVRPLCAVRRLLSGLMTPTSPLDLYYQFAFLDKSIIGDATYDAYRERIAHLRTINDMPNFTWQGGPPPVKIVDKSKGNNGFRQEEVDRVIAAVDRYSFRVPFNPKVPSTWSTWKVELTPEQVKAYREMKEKATTQLSDGSHVTSTVIIAQMIRMHQILLGHVVDEEGNFKELPENRSQQLLQVLEDYGGKAVIWCSYDSDVRKVSELLRKEYGDGAVSRFWGGNVRTREEEEKQFKSDPRCRFQVATPDAGGRGRTWDVADLAVFYSSRDNLDHREQAEMRTMDRDKSRGVENVDMIVPGTVEEKILHALRNKINMAAAINGDNWKEWVV